MTPAQRCWAEAGAPLWDGVKALAFGDRCWLCGGSVWVDGARVGAVVSEWLSDGFTGHDKVADPSSAVVCAACVYVSSRIAPVPGRPPAEGKKFGGNWRNYCHMWSPATGYLNASKGDKHVVRNFLFGAERGDGPWFAAIADSGQKHVLFYTPSNEGRSGSVAFDDAVFRLPTDAAAHVQRVTALLTAGATKDDILGGAYGPNAWRLCAAEIRRFEADIGARWRGSDWMRLAVWMAQRDEATVQARMEAEKAARAGKPTTPKTKTKKKRIQREPADVQAAPEAQDTRDERGEEVRDGGRRDDGGAQDGHGAVAGRDAPGCAVGGAERAEAVRPDSDADAGGISDDGERGRVGDERGAGASHREPKQLEFFGLA